MACVKTMGKKLMLSKNNKRPMGWGWGLLETESKVLWVDAYP